MKRRIVEIVEITSLQVKDILTRSFFELQTRHTIVLEALQGDLTFVESSRWWGHPRKFVLYVSCICTGT